MGWRFRKSIKIIPGVKINLGSKGISTTIGVRGASVNFSNKGTYLNTGIPGTGLSHRQKIGGNNQEDVQPANQNYTPNSKILLSQETDNILTYNIHEVTSQDMDGIKQAIVWAHEQRKELKDDLSSVKRSLFFSKTKLFFSKLILFSLYNKAALDNVESDINEQRMTISTLNESIDNSLMNLEVEFEEDIQDKYNHVTHFYEKLCKSIKIWDITGAYAQDRSATRSAASTAIKKTEIKIDRINLDEIKCFYLAFHFNNANGGDIYIYPDFIIMYSSIKEFAVIGFHEIDIKFSVCEFIEQSKIPSDSKVIDHTWAKVNKNGSRDKRFKDNYQIPVVRYGNITFKTKTGMNEAFLFSNYEDSRDFYNTLSVYQKTLNSIKRIA